MTDLLTREEIGSRTKRRRKRARRRFTARLMVVLLVVGVAAAGVYVTQFERKPKAPAAGAQRTVSSEGQDAILVAGTLQDDPSQQADSLTIFAAGGGAAPAAMFLPVGTLSPVPGQGYEAIGKSLAFGRPALAQLTVENMLGIDLDQTLVLDDLSVAKMIDALGGVDIDVTERLVERGEDGRSEAVFAFGEQHMTGAQAAVYMTYRGPEETELDRYPRMQKVWDATMERVRAGGSLDAAVAQIGGTLVDPEAVEIFSRILTAALPGGVPFEVLPAKPLGAGDDQDGYDLDEQVAADRAEKLFAGSLPFAGFQVDQRPRVELRNGNGTPEAGEQVASMLIPEGMKIEVIGNARRFDRERTKVLVYAATDDAMMLARKVQGLLGMGTIEIATRSQTVVDVTVVIGKDFVAS